MAGNRMLCASLALFALTNLASADVEFTKPKGGAKLTGGGTLDIEWKDSGEAPAIGDLTTYDLFLMAGGNDPAAVPAEMVRNTSFVAYSCFSKEYQLTLVGLDPTSGNYKVCVDVYGYRE